MIKNRGYQHNFSKIFPATMSDSQGREKKAKTMVAVLSDYLRSDLKPFSVLDIGSSTGIIANYLSKYFGKVVGIDIDKNAIAYAKNNFKKDNLQFSISDSMDIDYPDNSFDVIICAHVYEHVPDADRLMTAIHRVLKPGGVCYFSAGNRLTTVKEPHYNLPFLSVMPRYFAHRYMKIVGKGTFYYEKHLSYWGLKRLIRNFERIDYTKRIIENLELFYADYMIKHGTMKFALARLIVNYAYWLCPSFIWLLRKKCDIPNKLL